ncbi:MAG: alkaline phosphatase family protein, partial [Schleiferiaceae bacterium]|nr:alkaline phosphatase family protein [Schleiferiaceae bacterium]
LLLAASALVFISCGSEEPKKEVESQKETRAYKSMKIAFGSCNDEDEPSPIFESIANQEPDLFIWLGDNVYADSDVHDSIIAAYQKLEEEDHYLRFVNTGVKIMGTWDDHDYGQNDAGKEWGIKDESKDALLNFLKVDEGDDIRFREGVFNSRSFGDYDEIKVILLDTRYFRDSLVEDEDPDKRYTANPKGDVLGKAQWEWLEYEMSDTNAKVVIIGSSIQVLAQDHGWEKWANFPTAQEKLMTLINQSAAKVVLISGDRHFGEVSKVMRKEPIYDVTSSGLNHPFIAEADSNRFRVGPVISQQNFGLLNISWQGEHPQINASIRGLQDSLYYQIDIE